MKSGFLFLKATLLCMFFCVMIFSGVRAQQMEDTATAPHRGFEKERLFVGGSLGLSFGDYTYVTISPMVGYHFTNWFAAGVNVNAQYSAVKYRDFDNDPYRKERYGLGGIGVFTRLYPIPQLFAHIQPEMNFISGKIKYYDPPSEEKYTTHAPSLLLGVGYSQSTGGNSAFTIMVLYDVIQDQNSPYGDRPVFRAGVNIGF